MDKATTIPMNDCGLTINCGTDGTWLHFYTQSGLHASINVNSHAENKIGIIGRTMKAWCAERQKQAEQIRAGQGA